MTFTPGDLSAASDPFFNPPFFMAPRHPRWPEIRASLCTVLDPDMSVNLYELGLIHDVAITDTPKGLDVQVRMGLTSPLCHMAGELPMMVDNAISMLDNIASVDVDVVFDRTWVREDTAESARLVLNL